MPIKKQFILVSVLLIGLFLILAPYIRFQNTSLYDSKRILEVGLFVIATSVLIIQRNDINKDYFGKLFDARILITFLILFIAGSVSALLAPLPYSAWREILMFLALILFILLIGYHASSNLERHKKTILTIVIGYVAIYSIYFVGNYISAHISPLVPFWPDRIGYKIKVAETTFEIKEVLNFVNRRFFNQTQTWTFPILLGFLAYLKDQKVYYWLTFLFISIWWVLVFASGGRGTLLAVFVSALFIWYKYRNQSRKYINYFILSFVSGGILYLLLYHVYMPAGGVGISLWRDSSSGRVDMWLGALKTFLKNPIFGIGPYQYALVHGEPTYAHPHNFYIQLLVEWGIIAFIAIVMMLFSFGKWLLQEFDNKQVDGPDFLRIGLFGSIVAAFVHAFFSGIFHTPMSQVWLVLIGSYFVGYNLKSLNNNLGTLNGFFPVKYVKYTLVVVMLGFSFFVINDIRQLNQSKQRYIERFKTTQMYPRFWGQGVIYQKGE